MAITTFDSYVNNILYPVYNPVVNSCSSTLSGQTGYQILWDLYVNDNYKARIPIAPQPGGICLINSSKLLQNYVSYDLNTTLSGFALQQNSFAKVQFKLGESYIWCYNFDFTQDNGGYLQFSSATEMHHFPVNQKVNISYAAPSVYAGICTVTSVDDDYSFTSDIVYDSHVFSVAGSAQTYDLSATQIENVATGRTFYVNNSRINHTSWPSFSYGYDAWTSEPVKFMTNCPSKHYVKIDDKAWLNFVWMPKPAAPTPLSGVVTNMLITVVNKDATYQYVQYNPYSAETETNRRFLQVGVGPWNINQATWFPVISESGPTGTSPVIKWNNCGTGSGDTISYAIAMNGTGATSTLPTTFYMNQNSTYFDNYRLIGMDLKGSWFGFDFDLVNRKFIDVKKKTINKAVGGYSNSTHTWTYNGWDRGKIVVDTDLVENYVLNSNWLEDVEVPYFIEIIKSPEVYLQLPSDGSLIPVIVKDSNWETKQSVNSELIQYEVTIELANKESVQHN